MKNHCTFVPSPTN